jgi:hypothetical protein
LALLFGLGEAGWYHTWYKRLINWIMHVLPGAAAGVFAWMSLTLGALLLWGAWAAWRQAASA